MKELSITSGKSRTASESKRLFVKARSAICTFFDQSKDGVYITTRDGKLVEGNQAYLDLLGFSREEAQGLDIFEIYPEPAADNRQRFREAIEKTGAVKDYELKLKTKDGRLIDCLSTSSVKKGA